MKFGVVRHFFGCPMSAMLVLCAVSSIVMLTGCAAVKESAKGFAGVSTKVLEEKRSGAIKNEFAISYPECYVRVKKIVGAHDSYIYSDDTQKRLLAFYLSKEDTTVVGIFFTEIDSQHTRLEISSPSIYAKELIAKRVFSELGNPAQAETKGEATHVK